MVMGSMLQRGKGRVVHYAGDAVLADFVTVSDALTCAVDVQRDLKDRNEALADDRKVQFRIGVNLGHSDGRIAGSLQGNTLHGYWIQADSKRKCTRVREGSRHWGQVRVTFDDRFSAFSGGSSYCDEPAGVTNDWNGFRSTGRRNLKAILIAGTGHDTLGHPALQEAIKNFLRECCKP